MSAPLGLDTRCAVPLLSVSYPRHGQTAAAVGARLAAGDRLLIAGHVLLEPCSVLTRVPPPYRLRSREAQESLRLPWERGGGLTSSSASGDPWEVVDRWVAAPCRVTDVPGTLADNGADTPCVAVGRNAARAGAPSPGTEPPPDRPPPRR